MNDLQVIDQVYGWQVEAGDILRLDGDDYRVLDVPDDTDGEMIILSVEALDQANEADEIPVLADERYDLLDYDYSDVEV